MPKFKSTVQNLVFWRKTSKSQSGQETSEPRSRKRDVLSRSTDLRDRTHETRLDNIQQISNPAEPFQERVQTAGISEGNPKGAGPDVTTPRPQRRATDPSIADTPVNRSRNGNEAMLAPLNQTPAGTPKDSAGELGAGDTISGMSVMKLMTSRPARDDGLEASEETRPFKKAPSLISAIDFLNEKIHRLMKENPDLSFLKDEFRPLLHRAEMEGDSRQAAILLSQHLLGSSRKGSEREEQWQAEFVEVWSTFCPLARLHVQLETTDVLPLKKFC